MTTAIIGSNIRVEVQQTLGSAKTISAITKANPGVVSSTAHGFDNGDVVVLTVTEGMVELDGQACRVANKTTDAFELEGIDTSAYSTFSAGTCKEVTAFQTMAAAQNVSMPNPAPQKIDTTTLIDKSKQYQYGLPEAPDGTIAGLFNPAGTAEALIKAATKANTPLVFRLTYSDSRKSLFNANVSGGTGFDLQPNAAATANVSFTPVKDVLHYAT